MTLPYILLLDDQHFHSETSLRAKLFDTGAKITVKPVLEHFPINSVSLNVLKFLEKGATFVPTLPDVNSVKVETENTTNYWITPKGEISEKVLIYFHGGAFLSCGTGTHKRFVEKISSMSKINVLNVGYRQFPEVTFDSILEDCWEAVHYVLDEGFTPEEIYLGGDSAGGGLAFLMANKMLKEGFSPAGVISISGWLNYDHQDKVNSRWKNRDSYIPASRLEEIARKVFGREIKPEDSPVNNIGKNFPKTLLISGGHEVLRVDSDSALEKLLQYDLQFEVHYFSGGFHAFPVACELLPEGKEAFNIITNFLNS